MGRAWKFGNNVNTDLITPGRYNLTAEPAELAKICFVEYRPEFAREVRQDDFVVGGRNFGCGSSRETAVIALKAAGVRAVIAQSFARIFYRNCINNGLLAIELNAEGIQEGDELEYDEQAQKLRNATRDEEYEVNVPQVLLTTVREGGVAEFIRKKGFEALEELFANDA
ncbi:3-isopropylmalate dehydratase [Candidatus Micrarchaeota archaeon]|nr:MAG: 3-isopropylmalate dehydratase [Candidatus Micrarchaeota archaeon]